MKKVLLYFSISLTTAYWLIGLASYIFPNNILYKYLFLGYPTLHFGVEYDLNNNPILSSDGDYDLKLRVLSYQTYKGENYYLYNKSIGVDFMPEGFGFGIPVGFYMTLLTLFNIIILTLLIRKSSAKFQKIYLNLLLLMVILFSLNVPHIINVIKEWQQEDSYWERLHHGI